MGFYDPDAYYQPEKLGLEKVAELDLFQEAYEFDIAVVWEHVETGDLYFAVDAGCSCPSPFEWATSLDALRPLTAASWDELLEATTPYCWGGDYHREPYQGFSAARSEFLKKAFDRLGAGDRGPVVY